MKRAMLLAGAIATLMSVSVPCFAERPANGIQFRIGGMYLDHEGDLWRDTEEIFTIEDSSDFDEITIGFSFVTAPNNYFEIGVNADFYDGTFYSRYREWTDEDGFSIYHDTNLAIMPLTADFRYLPWGRYRIRPGGRQVRKPVFYVGVGLGVSFWYYEEIGDFIDFDNPELPIITDQFEDSGAAFETHVLAGVEIPVAPRFNFVAQGRYSWADDTMGEDFSGFGEIDLSGTTISVGGSFRF